MILKFSFDAPIELLFTEKVASPGSLFKYLITGSFRVSTLNLSDFCVSRKKY